MNTHVLSWVSGGALRSQASASITRSSFLTRLFQPLRTFRTATVAIFVGALPTLAVADAVTDWNAIMVTTLAPGNPFVQTRAGAIVQLSVFQAVNTITGDYEPYIDGAVAPTGASPEAAAVAAAHRALVSLYPTNAVTLDAARAVSLAAIPDGQAKDDGVAVGESAAAAMLQLRANDGSGAVVPYTPGTNPGAWQPAPPAFAPALLPGWGAVMPFGLQSGSQFRPPAPPAISSRKYARDYKEVLELGHVNSTQRPQDRTNVARFYAAVSPVPLYNSAVRQVSLARGLSLSQNARNFALLGMALSDALISSMEAKYHYVCWRPVMAIRAGNTDNNANTNADPTWMPLITTPAFPSYPSNHACAGGAARAVLERLFGDDDVDVTLITPAMPGFLLHYTSWKQITDDIDDARIYGGIHFRFEQEAGAKQGRRVGLYLLRNELRPRHGCDRD